MFSRKPNLIAVFLAIISPAIWAFPPGFVYLDEVIPQIRVDMRYAGSHNFVGRPVVGYLSHRPVMTEQAANALSKVQDDLRPFGLQLLIYDTYRPQQAVNDFVDWSKDETDTRTKREFYPNLSKSVLFPEGYIAEHSSHSRGSTVDLSIVQLLSPYEPLDMGSGFDFFGPESWPEYEALKPQQHANRLLLRTLMIKQGFAPYDKEWWHFTYKNEPFPETYFNFVVE
ncbi:MAG: M15 family metallopeptidase [Fluviibacter sp.]